jgi:hypothetical protein
VPDQLTASADLAFPAGPGEPFYPGWEAKFAYFTFTGTDGGLVEGIPDVLYFALVTRSLTPARGDCVACFWGEVLCLLNIDCGIGCGRAPIEARGSPITTLQRYRDEVLAATEDGQYYIDLYNQFSFDLIEAIVASPSLAARLFNAHGAWVNGLQALVDGQGASFIVTQQMEDDLLALLQTFQDVGSTDLSTMIAFESARLQLDQIAGLTIADYQAQVETLGGPTSVESTSWGRIKSLYH